MRYKLINLPILGKIKKIYFVGIKGVGMAPLALIAKGGGYDISGSDTAEEFITDHFLLLNNIPIQVGFDSQLVSDFFGGTDENECLVITTGAHGGFDNPQVKWSKEKGIAFLSQGQALSIFMQGDIFDRSFKSIAVAGSHGKTTISSLLATTLKALGEDPSYSVGTGEVNPLGAPGYLGNGEYFVVEADEYSSEPVYDKIPKFLYLHPSYSIFNNIDYDHPDLFRDIVEIENAFLEFAHNIRSGGKLLVNGDDKYLSKFTKTVLKDISVISYGEALENDYVISQIVTRGLTSRFNVVRHGVELGHFELSIVGTHNAKNALAVIALLSELGFEAEKIRICLREFEGTKRRIEIVGSISGGAMMIDDYAHHPKEIQTTLRSLHQAYPDKKLICIFQPHTYSRTKSLLTEFGKSFGDVFKLLLLPVFASARDTEKDTLSTEEYVNAHKEYTDTKFFENFSDVIEYVEKNYTSSEYIIITMGAGDVYKIGYKMVSKS